MERRIKLSNLITLILGFISFSWLVYDFFAFSIISPKIVSLEGLGQLETTLGALVWIGYLVIFLFHVSAILTLILLLQFHKKLDALKGMALFLCLLSLFGLMGDYSLLNDIGKESQPGGEVQSEWFVLYMVTIFHVLFHLVMFFLLFKSFRGFKRQEKPEDIVKSVDKGLLLTGTIGQGTDTTTGDISIGAFGLWIEDGKPVFPVAEITISSNLADLLKGVEMVGNDLRYQRSTNGPTVKVAEMTIGGTTAKG